MDCVFKIIWSGNDMPIEIYVSDGESISDQI